MSKLSETQKKYLIGVVICAVIIIVIVVLKNNMGTFETIEQSAKEKSSSGYDAGHEPGLKTGKTREENTQDILRNVLAGQMGYPTEESVDKGLFYPKSYTPDVEALYKPYNKDSDRWGPIDDISSLDNEQRIKVLGLDDSILQSHDSYIKGKSGKVTSGASHNSERSHLEVGVTTRGLVRIPVGSKIVYPGSQKIPTSQDISMPKEVVSSGSAFRLGTYT